MRQITIIGANSYIARNFIAYLSKYSDIGLFLYDYQEFHFDKQSNYMSINFSDDISIKKINLSVDAIYFFTGKTGTIDGFSNFQDFININEVSLLKILNECAHLRTSAKIIFPSTRLVYKGKDGIISENDEKEFKTLYAMNKFSCENYLKMFSNFYKLKYCILRICLPYGSLVSNVTSYGTAEFMLRQVKETNKITLYGDGLMRRTLTHIEDLCYILKEAGTNDKCLNDVYNVGGEDYSLQEMASLISRKYGANIEYINWPEASLKIESGNTVFDSSKLDNLLDLKHHHTFAEWILSENQI